MTRLLAGSQSIMCLHEKVTKRYGTETNRLDSVEETALFDDDILPKEDCGVERRLGICQ